MLVRKGARVDIVVAKKLIQGCIMPKVTGMRIQDAEKENARMGLRSRVFNPRYGGVELVTHPNTRPGFRLRCGDLFDLATMPVVQ